jgi:hypothetical protein
MPSARAACRDRCRRRRRARPRGPLTAAQAATAILDGVRRGEWRILVGEDARLYDVAVREHPVTAYEPSFVETMAARGAGISIVR